MKRVFSTLFVTAGLFFASTSSFAACTMWAVLGSPELPSQDNLQYDTIATLEKDMKAYVARAEKRLEQCSEISSIHDYNVAVWRLENKVADYNELVRYYNNASTLASK
jgi:hypothetical protein